MHHAQSRRSTQSALDIFNTLDVFTIEPIKKQEIKENMYQYQIGKGWRAFVSCHENTYDARLASSLERSHYRVKNN